MKRTLKRFAVWLLCLSTVLPSMSGCASPFKTASLTPSFKPPALRTPTWDDWSVTEDSDRKLDEGKYPVAAKIVATWTEAVYKKVGTEPIRGFGGRIYFYDKENHVIPVEGQLVVYAYDDSDPTASQVEPKRKYVFTPEQFTNHFSETDLGASYSVWIPWDKVGGETVEVSLVPVFRSSTGSVVTGTPATNLLTGKPRDKTEAEMGPSVLAVQQASHLQSIPNRDLRGVPAANNPMNVNTANQSLRTSTFNLPSNLKQQMLRAQAEAQAKAQAENQRYQQYPNNGAPTGSSSNQHAPSAMGGDAQLESNSGPTPQPVVQDRWSRYQRPTNSQPWRYQVPASPSVQQVPVRIPN